MATNYPLGRDEFGEPGAPDQTPLSSAGTGTRNHVEHHRDLGDAIESLQEHATTTVHDHSGVADEHGNITPKLKQKNTHEDADTDSSPSSIHHTLGGGENQAAPGNHVHDFNGDSITNKPFQIATSTTLPVNPVHGMQVFETDTHKFRVFTDIPTGSARRWVLMPGGVVPICRLTQNTRQRILSGGSFLEWDKVEEQADSMFNLAGNRAEVIIPEDGLYDVAGAIAWDPDILFGDNAYTEIYVNGLRTQYIQSQYVRGHLFNPGFSQTVPAGGRIRLKKGDRVSLRARHNGAFAQWTRTRSSADGIASRFDVVFLGP